MREAVRTRALASPVAEHSAVLIVRLNLWIAAQLSIGTLISSRLEMDRGEEWDEELPLVQGLGLSTWLVAARLSYCDGTAGHRHLALRRPYR